MSSRRWRHTKRWLRAHGRDAVVIGGAVVATGVLSVLAFHQPEPPPGAGTSAPLPEPSLNAEPALDVPANPQTWILGDSFTEGVGASEQSKGYAYVTADRLGWPTHVDGVGGSGYTLDGPSGEGNIYRDRIEAMLAGDWRPDLVIVQGGLNDYQATPKQLTRAFTSDVKLLRHRLPGVEVVAFGPVASAANNVTTANIDDTIEQAASEAGVPYVSPIDEGWITEGNTGRYIGDDGYHPTDAGHAYLAKRLTKSIEALTR